jgi:DNA-binding NarL/FixJ family response regulator
MTKYRLLLVDDSAEVVRGLQGLLALEDDIEVVGVATGGREAVETAKVTKPDVVVMDLFMEGMDGLEAAKRIRRQKNRPEVVILSVHDLDSHKDRAAKAGIRAWVPKTEPLDRLLAEIRRGARVARGYSPAYRLESTPEGGVDRC